MNKKTKKRISKVLQENGFSLVEIVVVIAVLSILSGVSIPNVLKSIKLNRLDEAKILMDSYASECLQEFRLGNDLSNTSPVTYSEKKLNALGYKKTVGSSCSNFGIEPNDVNENILFQLDFRIGSDSGTLIKTATPSSDTSSQSSCELWAGDLCTTDNAKKLSWNNIFTVEANKAKCEKDFFDWRNTLPSGSFNRWDEGSESCSKKTWVHKNFIADTATKYQEIKTNEECSSAKEPFSEFTGEKYIPLCQKTFYFYKGVDMGSKELMQYKLIDDQEVKCKVNREEKRLTAGNGKQSGEVSSGSCGNAYWICNNKILSTLDQWKESDCFTN